ncbi:chemotaxis protein CheW [Scytonema sp. UIC 10036]|uniref:chemotaxis protein CheW n=1 Tax=Scytonema sp. UIC 10036 TaxID=2304196 RepID=UPI0012DA6504|nr:chemotaxis protein CheW [Scytonema sp. UIC 10036]MUH01866.1 chemotaxis protein CheW [Scytonema sp. UIC 10036]
MLLLLFNIGTNSYAIESSHVVEVIPRVAYREVHHVPKYVTGLFNYRGAIVPVIDLCHLIRGTPSQTHLSTRVIMVSYPCKNNTLQYVGLMAERVVKTLNKPKTEFIPSGLQAHEVPYLGEMIMDEKGMIQHIHLERLFINLRQINLLEPEEVKTNDINSY